MAERNFIDDLMHKLSESQKETGQKFGGLAEGVGNAIDDIRSKVVEEGWFGRTVSPDVEVNKEVKLMSLADMQAAMGYREQGKAQGQDQEQEKSQERSRGPSL